MRPIPRIDTLYEDDHLLVVNKPSGLSVHRGWDPDPVNAVRVIRKSTGRNVFPVHRLDRATSGVLVFALDAETTRLLQEGFHHRDVEKRYLALVRGITPEGGTIDHPVPHRSQLSRPRRNRGEESGGVEPPAVPKADVPRLDAVTHYRRLEVCLDRYSLIEAVPETGRTHQIRRHMKHVNHPLIGDVRYGDGRENRRLRTEYGLLRLALHASQICLTHPHTGVRLEIAAPMPDDLRVPFERAGLTRLG